MLKYFLLLQYIPLNLCLTFCSGSTRRY